MLEQSVTAIPARREVLQGSMAQRVRVVQAVRLRRAPRSPAAFSFRSDLVLNDIKLELSALTHAHARALTCVPPPLSLSLSLTQRLRQEFTREIITILNIAMDKH